MDVDAFIASQQLEIEELRRENDYLRHAVQASQRIELIMESSNAILFRRLAAKDPGKRKMVYVSPNISRFGYTAGQFLSGEVMFRDLVYHEDSPRTLKEIREFVEQGVESYTQFYRIVTREGAVRWVEDRTSIYLDELSGLRYHQGIVIDIHDRRVIEEKLARSEERHRRVIETTAEGVLFLDGDGVTVDLNEAYEQLTGRPRKYLLGRQPVEITPSLRTYQKRLDQNDGQLVFEAELASAHGKRIPVLIHLGAVVLESGRPLGAAAFITDISSQKKALLLAAEVQRGLLPPQPPVIPYLDISAMSVPCDEVGGDYFDYFLDIAGRDDLAVVIGDISGHGVDAALLMSSARSYLKACHGQSGSPMELIGSLNRHLVGDMMESGRFMTLFYLVMREEGTSLEWIRAGHDPGLLYDPDIDRFTELKGPGAALGIDAELAWHAQRLDGLAKGSIILLATDGLWEAMNDDGQMFGKERLRAIVRANRDHDSRRILQELTAVHREFCGDTPVADDMTMIVIQT